LIDKLITEKQSEDQIRFRIDVDYPFSSRIKSFVYITLGIKIHGHDYLKNGKTIARMINDSSKDVKACWFFTSKTAPDTKLLALLHNDKHEIAFHLVNDPDKELEILERAVGKRIRYYTIHGTARILARIMWRRWKAKLPRSLPHFQLESFHQFPKRGLDTLCYSYLTISQVHSIIQKCIKESCVVFFHPIWLLQRGKLNQRGSFYENLRRILEVDKEFESLMSRRKIFVTIARDRKEYERDVAPTEETIKKLREIGIDIFTFVEGIWRNRTASLPKRWQRANDNVSLLKVTSYEEWWKNIGKKTRNMVRKAEKRGIRTEVTDANVNFAEGIWRIYNETPIRQERSFSHYGAPVSTVIESVISSKDCKYIGAYLEDELVGFVQLVEGEDITILSQILSYKRHFDKAVNNALIAKTVEVCANNNHKWILYGRMGNHPSLDRFKQNNGFNEFQLNRYYIPLTRKGKIAIVLKLHRELKDILPRAIKNLLFPLYNWIDRTRMQFKLKLRSRKKSSASVACT